MSCIEEHQHNFVVLSYSLHYARTFLLLELLLKIQVNENFLHSEVNLIIQYIILQDQDGQNNNSFVSI